MAAPYGITFACDNEKPANLTMEYFTEELRSAGVDFKKETPCLLTMAGYSPDRFTANKNRMEIL